MATSEPAPLTLGRSLRVLTGGLIATAATIAGWYIGAGRSWLERAAVENRRVVARLLLGRRRSPTVEDCLAAGDQFILWAVALMAVAALAIALAPVLHPWIASWRERIDRVGRNAGRTRLALGLIVGLAFSTTVALARFALDAFPNSGDEVCFLYQAETFARGRLFNAPHALQDFFSFYHIRQVDGRLFSVFPPGWPAVLMVALRAGVPTWLVNPILAAALLVLTFVLARHLHGVGVALATTGLVAVAPFFLFNAASYFSHTFCALLVVAFAYCGVRSIEQRHAGWAAAAAALLGAGFLTRNYTVAWCALPYAVALVACGRFGWRAIAAAILSGLPFVLISLAYNTAIMGDPFAPAMGSGFETYDSRWFPRGWVWSALGITAEHLWQFVAWTPPALLGVYVWGWSRTGRLRAERFTDFLFPALVLGYFFYVDRGGNQYGPRYYHEAFPFVSMFAAEALFRKHRVQTTSRGAAWAWYLLAVSVVCSVPLLGFRAVTEARVVVERSEPFRLAREKRLQQAVVLIATGSGWTRPMSALDLTRNDPDFANPVLYAHDRGDDTARLMAWYPDRSFWRYRFDPARRAGTLELVRDRLHPLAPVGVRTPPAGRRGIDFSRSP